MQRVQASYSSGGAYVNVETVQHVGERTCEEWASHVGVLVLLLGNWYVIWYGGARRSGVQDEVHKA